MENEGENVIFEKNTIFTIVGRKNPNKDYLVYYIINKFKNYGYKLGVVMGEVNPYIRYFSDNIFIRYDNIVFHNYLEKMKEKKLEGILEENILVIDTEHLNLNIIEWLYFLENYKKYNTTILFIIDKIKQSNINLLKKYTDYAYILNIKNINLKPNIYLGYKNHFINTCYRTFGKLLNYETFFEIYDKTVEQDIILLVLNKNETEECFYSHIFYKCVKEYYFETIKLFNDTEKHNNIYKIRDILKINGP
jgi:hypothetical protein